MDEIKNYDSLQMYFGEDYIINDFISIRQPTVGDVINMGEQKYYSTVYLLTTISSDIKSILWDMGYDWTELSDFEMFYLMTRNLNSADTRIFFGDLNLSEFKMFRRDDGELLMVNPSNNVTINKYIHFKISTYLCALHSIKKKPELPGNKHTKIILIQDDRIKRRAKSDCSYKSQLLPLVSSMVNSAGFKYSINSIKDLKIYAFMDSVMRVQAIKSADHLTSAYYSGNIDTKKFDTKKLNWLCDLQENK
ncbi:MAG: hypothetical protein RR365_01005 [Bacteroides sp.]